MAGRVAFDTTFLIGTNDLWIAAASLRHGPGLVTADSEAFSRVEGLEVVPYR